MHHEVALPHTSEISVPVSFTTGLPRALILDDSPVDRRRLKQLCDKAEVALDFTEVDSISALDDRLLTETHDIIFIDYRLGDGDGLAALRHIKKDLRHRDAATIMVAGVAQAQIAVAALKGGCDDYVLKDSMDPLWLQRSVTAALEKSTLRRQFSDSRASREILAQALRDFSHRCTTEMIPMLSRLLRQSRALRRSIAQAGLSEAEATALERSCADLWAYAQGLEQSALQVGYERDV